MYRKSEDTAARRQSYSRPMGKKTFKEDIYKFLQDFKAEQVEVLEKLTNEVIGLKNHLAETKNEGNRKEIKNKNGIIYADLEFMPFEENKRKKEEYKLQENCVYQVPLQQNDIKLSPFEADLLRKVENLTIENELYNKRIDVMQNQLNLFHQKLQQLEMKEDRLKENNTLVQTISECCNNICYQHYRDISHTIMAFWEAGKPPSREAVVEWFRNQELKRGVGFDENNKPVDWFHGLITRSEAEQILQSKPEGSFLVRLSERVWGYAVSYRCAGHCKHYLVEATAGYRLLPGTGMDSHNTLADLINYHKTVPITETGEILRTACPPARTPVV